jgi:hypothetical protein
MSIQAANLMAAVYMLSTDAAEDESRHVPAAIGFVADLSARLTSRTLTHHGSGAG